MQILTFPHFCNRNLHINVKKQSSCILNFANMQILTFRTVYSHNLHVYAKLSSRLVERLQKYGEFLISNMAFVRHFKFQKCANFNLLHCLRHQSAKIGNVYLVAEHFGVVTVCSKTKLIVPIFAVFDV